MKLWRLLFISLVCAFAAGCGSDSNSSGSTPVIPAVQGTWTGEYVVASCTDPTGLGLCAAYSPVGAVLPVRLGLSQTGQQLTGNLVLGAFTIPVSGTINAAGRMVLTGSASGLLVGQQTTVTIVNWDTVVAGSNMTGGWRNSFAISGVSGSPYFDSTIRLLTKTG